MRLLLGASCSLLHCSIGMPSLLVLATTITILSLPASLAEPGVRIFQNSFDSVQIYFFSSQAGGSVHKPPVGSLGNLPGQLAQLFLWSMDNLEKKMSEQDRYQLVGKQNIPHSQLSFCHFSGGRGRSFDASCFGGQELPRICWQLASCWQHG